MEKTVQETLAYFAGVALLFGIYIYGVQSEADQKVDHLERLHRLKNEADLDRQLLENKIFMRELEKSIDSLNKIE